MAEERTSVEFKVEKMLGREGRLTLRLPHSPNPEVRGRAGEGREEVLEQLMIIRPDKEDVITVRKPKRKMVVSGRKNMLRASSVVVK